MELPSSGVSFRFIKLRRLEVLFEKLVHFSGFKKQFSGGKVHAKLIVDRDKKGEFNYIAKNFKR